MPQLHRARRTDEAQVKPTEAYELAQSGKGMFQVKDSGKRMEFDSGMVRDTTEGKTRYDLVLDGPMFTRWAEHLTKGAEKYAARNWMKASGDAELDRFRESALRHFVQWYYGQVDEDHASAVFFNINGAEYVRSLGPTFAETYLRSSLRNDPADGFA